ncbi:ferrous iron transport protein B [Traorella massiliensis]|uniref:ferrous iron transport protein B n=1 Tax=Traorella massiliensis TaxID=1903263 RepID=UPI000A9B518D|nr:ferrous iron transport protein B [Traorella massiliensis]
MKYALVGNPNCGKTTLFNELTGSSQYVGNWPGVTVEKKEGKLKGRKDVIIQDLPGIYSLSPYTLEEVVARNYIVNEHPDVIINIVDATNLERNLYLTTQVMELGVPMVIALNMMDVVRKNKDEINVKELEKRLNCKIVEISAVSGEGCKELMEAAHQLEKQRAQKYLKYEGELEKSLEEVSALIDGKFEHHLLRWYAVKLLENDEKVAEEVELSESIKNEISKIRTALEEKMDDDAESIITSERYERIGSILKNIYVKKNQSNLSMSDKIDKVVTNRWLALPIFVVVMWLVYYISVTTIGTWATDWANDGVFGEGWHLFGIGTSEYEEDAAAYSRADQILSAASEGETTVIIYDDEDVEIETVAITDSVVNEAETIVEAGEPDTSEYGIWVPGVPVIVGDVLESAGVADWLYSLIIDGIIGGVGAVLGFLPQMMVLFLLLALLEDCGYMARIAFIMDRIFRKFGLSGKSFIPMLIGTGCGVPAIMASRTIENDRDRKMTIMTTTFIPCSAKLPIIALIAGALFNNASWVSPSAYFVGMAAIIVSGIILKKTKLFEGDVAPFVMELPAYHMPKAKGVLLHMWDRSKAFAKKAGTIIFVSAIVLWFLQGFNWQLEMVDNNESILASIGNAFAFIFSPLGFGNWKATVATVTGLIAKENVVSTFGVLYGFAEVAEDGVEIWGTLASEYTMLSAYSFLVFNLLCAPCFAAIGAISREMGSAKWTWIAIGYQCCFAYAVALIIYQLGTWITTGVFGIETIFGIVVLAGLLYLLLRPAKKSE